MTTQDLARLEELLSLDFAPARAFTPEIRDEITELFGRARDKNDLAELATRAAKELSHYGENLRARYAMAFYQELFDAKDDSGKGYHQLARDLIKQEAWEMAREMVLRALPLRPDYRIVRTLLEIWPQIPEEAINPEDLIVAGRLCPDAPDLIWYRSRIADAEGRIFDAAELACEALSKYISVKEADRAEEPLLRVLEANLPEITRKLIKLLPRMVIAGLNDLYDAALEMSWSTIERHGLMNDLVRALERALLKRKNIGQLRMTYVKALAASLGDVGQISTFIRECGLEDPEIPFEDALTQFREMYGIRPGAFVYHPNFGVGQIVGHEKNFLIINFNDKPNHRLALEIARRSLRSLPDKCLQVAMFVDPVKLRNEIDNDPVAILVRALTELGGEAQVRDLRECLIAHTIDDSDWTKWWKSAIDKSAHDDRIDLSQKFRQVYRLGGMEGEGSEVKLPPLPVKTTAQSLSLMIEKFLRQHPEMEDDAIVEYADELAARVRAATPQDACTGLPLLLRWLPELRDEWKHIASTAFRREPGVAGGINAEDQLVLLDLGLEDDAIWHHTAMSAIASRFPQVRERAFEALRKGLGEGFTEAMRDQMLSRDWRISTRLALVKVLQDEAFADVNLTAWDFLIGALNVLSSNPPPKIRQSALELMDPHESLGRLLSEAQWSDDDWERFYRAAREVATSEIGLEPLSIMLEMTGHGDVISRIRVESEGNPDPIAIHFDSSVMLMSRVTYESNLARIEDLQHQMATVIPQEIAAARALGDLSENAEYHAARERQGIADATIRSLQSQMHGAKIIEDVEMPDGVVVAGTEVVVRDLNDDTQRKIWLLGQGDSVQDDTVINYIAPLGQALVGKKPGEVAELEINGNMHRLQVISITPKLP